MRIAIMGSGGLGGYYGGMLARAGEDVTFIARGAHLEAIRSDGLTVKLPSGEEFTLDAKATSDPGEMGRWTWFCSALRPTIPTPRRSRSVPWLVRKP